MFYSIFVAVSWFCIVSEMFLCILGNKESAALPLGYIFYVLSVISIHVLKVVARMKSCNTLLWKMFLPMFYLHSRLAVQA